MKLFTVSLGLLVLLQPLSAQQRGIINNADSPAVKLRSINLGDCRWTEGFWAEKFKLCEAVMVPHMGTILKGGIGHGYDNFKIAAGLQQGKHEGFAWHDGDFYKWMESAMYVYAVNRDERIVRELEEIIAVIAQAQKPDGYLSTFNQIQGIKPFTHRNHHELYNAGHLMTSACIYQRVTGRTNLLEIARKNADYLYGKFQPRPKELARFGFNQSQIMGLVELYRTTKDRRYLELAGTFINMRGASRVEPDSTVNFSMIGDMVQERKPLRKETEAVGHAVLALYFYAGAADVAAETGEKALIAALDRLWENIVNTKMYVTGACGQTHHGASSQSRNNPDFVHEAFLDGYMMPNLTAYNETCANIANAMFSHRLLGLHGESKYADIMELVMYNSALSGISAGGTEYIYANPLRVLRGARDYSKLATETPDRQPYLECFCCPPNIVRTIAQLSGWAYSLSADGVAVNLYGGNTLATRLLDGSELRLRQETQYPWEGAVKLTFEACKAAPFEMLLRIPGWAEGATIRINGGEAGVAAKPGTFARIHRAWKAGDAVALTMPMEARLLVGNPRIEEVRNQAAIKRGPVVYCVETPDLPGNADVLGVYLPSDIQLKVHRDPKVMGGLAMLSGEALWQPAQQTAMYQPLAQPEWKKAGIKFVPYYAWGNRGKGDMTVWMPIVWR